MTKLDKVIKGLECCKAIHIYLCTDCPYHDDDVDDNNCKEYLCADALTLLKEHEATMVIESENMYTGLPITHCPKCGVTLDRFLYGRQHEGQINYCPMCGQAIKWE